MIGGIIGGSSSSRLSQGLKHIEMESLSGRSALAISGLAEYFPILNLSPTLLAPGHYNDHPIDVLAECYNLVDGLDNAINFFADSALSSQGENIYKTSNDRYWSESMRLGLKNFFQIAGILSSKERKRSISQVLCDCFDSISSSIQATPLNESPNRPDWMNQIPSDIKANVNTNYLGRANSTVQTHISTMLVFIEELRRVSPKGWTDPFLSTPRKFPVFVYTPSWGSAPLQIILKVCLRSNFSIILPELHMWPQAEIERIGSFLEEERSKANIIWTSMSMPNHIGFKTDWEIFCRSSQQDNIAFFQKKLNLSGGNSPRLKHLKFETPASLDKDHGILHFNDRWSIIPLSQKDIKKTPLAASKEQIRKSYLEDNMRRLLFDRDCEDNHTESDREFKRLRRKYALPLMNKNNHEIREVMMPNLKNICSDEENDRDQEHIAIANFKDNKPQFTIAVYRKICDISIPPLKDILDPKVDAYLPITIKDNVSTIKNEQIEVYSSYFDTDIKLIVHDLKKLPSATSLVAYGTWLEPRKVFLVRSFLSPLRTSTDKILHKFTPGILEDVLLDRQKLQKNLRSVLDQLDHSDNTPEKIHESIEELRKTRLNIIKNTQSSMNKIHERGYLKESITMDNTLTLGLGKATPEKKIPGDSLYAIKTKSLIPGNYRDILKNDGQSNLLTIAFDMVFASLLLNADTEVEDGHSF